MAIYHASTKPVSRAAGRTAPAAAAYRSASRVVEHETGQIHDYRKKSGVVAAGIVMPDGTRATHLREQLWNAAEAAEKRKDARVAREWVIALPDELNKAQRIALAANFAKTLAARYGVAADLAVHEPSRRGDDRNHHAHILLTTRQAKLGADGIELGEKASIELSDKARKERGMKPAADDVKRLRKLWADMANAALAEAGHEERIDHRSHAERGIDEMPTTHLGPKATAIKRKGKKLDIEERVAKHWQAAQKAAADELAQARAEYDLALRDVQELVAQAGISACDAAMLASTQISENELEEGAQRIALAVRNAAYAQCRDSQEVFAFFEVMMQGDPDQVFQYVEYWCNLQPQHLQQMREQNLQQHQVAHEHKDLERNGGSGIER